ncbi:unnamed protein product [Prunus brigantina]
MLFRDWCLHRIRKIEELVSPLVELVYFIDYALEIEEFQDEVQYLDDSASRDNSCSYKDSEDSISMGLVNSELYYLHQSLDNTSEEEEDSICEDDGDSPRKYVGDLWQATELVFPPVELVYFTDYALEA